MHFFVNFIGNAIYIFITTDCMQSTLNESSVSAEPDLGDIRLSDGCSGELEVYSNPLNSEGWYSVCADSSGFLESASRVVCKQLGCPVDGATQTFRYTHKFDRTGKGLKITQRVYDCSGQEPRLGS